MSLSIKFIIPQLILVRFGTIKIQIKILSEEQFNQFWERAFENRNVDEKVLTFNSFMTEVPIK